MAGVASSSRLVPPPPTVARLPTAVTPASGHWRVYFLALVWQRHLLLGMLVTSLSSPVPFLVHCLGCTISALLSSTCLPL